MDLTSLNVSLPKALKEYVTDQIANGNYSTPSEFVRELIREDRKRQSQEKLEAVLLDGLASGPATEIGKDFWTRKRREIRRKQRSTKTAR